MWLRSLGQLEARQVPGTELEGRSPFFSPDGQSLAYYAAGELKRVSVTGGAPVTLAKIVNPWGASWADDDRIFYGQGRDGIWQIPAQGGTPERVIAVGEGELAQGPQLLAGGEWMLFTLRPRGVGSWNRAQIVIQSLSTGERTVLIDGGRDARYVPPGHLIYGLNGSLLAVPFDLRTRRVTGSAVPVVRSVYDAGTITGAVHYGVAADGSGMAEHLTDGAGGVRALTWTPEGRLIYEELAATDVRVLSLGGGSAPQLIPLFDAPEYFYERLPALAPDGRWLAYQSIESGTMEIYVRPFPNVSSGRWQISSGGGFAPLWSREGREIFYRNASSIVAVQIQTDPVFRVMTSSPLFNLGGYVLAGQRGIRYDVGPDGRFLLLKNDSPADVGLRRNIVLVQNWTEELKRLVPVD